MLEKPALEKLLFFFFDLFLIHVHMRGRIHYIGTVWARACNGFASARFFHRAQLQCGWHGFLPSACQPRSLSLVLCARPPFPRGGPANRMGSAQTTAASLQKACEGRAAPLRHTSNENVGDRMWRRAMCFRIALTAVATPGKEGPLTMR